MTVQFVMGRAGSGKTHHCLESIRSLLREDPVDGPSLLFLVPEQASLQMEQSLLTQGAAAEPGPAAYHRAQVLSFQRLAHLVLDEAYPSANHALTEVARIMVLRHLVHRLRPRLQYYRRADRLGGFLDHLGRTISEFIQEAVSPAALDVEAVGAEAFATDPRQQAKLHDLRLIYADYLEYLGPRRVDPSQHLGLARKRLNECAWLSGALLWVDGFASFSEQELTLLVEIARLAAQTQITALLDPSVGAVQTAGLPLFRRTFETLQRLRKRFRDEGIEELDPLPLAPPVLPRYAVRPALADLERRIFRQPQLGVGAGVHAPEGIRLVELPSPRIEVDFALAQICRWVQQPAARLRYRDTAIIVRDLDVYHDLLRNALTIRHIPFFIDRRRPLTHHPLVALIRAAVRIAAENASSESMRQLLKVDLLPFSSGEVDAIENHLLATGLSGFDAWSAPWPPYARELLQDRREFDKAPAPRKESGLDGLRSRLHERLSTWMQFAISNETKGGPEWALSLRALLVKLEAGHTIAAWTRAAEDLGDLEVADEHRQAWDAVFSIFDDLAFAFEAAPLSVDELLDVVESALASLTLGLVPPTVDQVLVGAIERSRHPNIRAAVLLGFNDGVFPSRPTEESILNDDDRALLRHAGLTLAPPARERVKDESLLAYIALTRASEQLVITYSATDTAGKPVRPSPFIEDVRAAVGGLTVETVADPVQTRATWDVLGTPDLRRRLTEEFRSRPARQLDDAALRSRWNSVYAGCRESLARDGASRAAIASLDPAPDAKLNPMLLRRWFTPPLETSVSQLETYASCPFKYLARNILRLRERDEANLEPMDIGRVHHAVLAEFTKRLMAQGRRVGELEDIELDEHLRESCAAVSTRFDHSPGSARDAYVLGRIAQRLAKVVRSQRWRHKDQSVRARAAELDFGFAPSGLPSLKIQTPAGRTIALRGFIDHVDLFELADDVLGFVTDYKARGQRLDMSKAYHGVSLQLLAYLLALAESGTSLGGRPIRPAGALYVAIHPVYKEIAHPSLLGARDMELQGSERPRGVLLGDALDTIDRSGAEWSRHFQAFRKKDGMFGRLDSSDVAMRRDFDSLLAHTRRKLGELADALLDGDIGVKPCRIGTFSPCSWCEMASVCRFEMGLCDARFLESMKRLEVFRRISTVGDRST